jgi:hypothetical protein
MNEDFRDFFRLLNARSIEFLVIGGVAYNFHAPPRATKDIDIWVNPEADNLRRLVAAIREFGFPAHEIDIDDLARSERVLMLGRVPNRIDVLTRPRGVDFAEAWSRRVVAHYGDVPIGLLALDDLIAAKRAAARPQDLADAARLEKIRQRNQRDA